MQTNLKNMKVGRIEIQKGRILLFESKINKGGVFMEYHVIAPEQSKVKIDDEIKYEPYYDLSFGWIVED